MSNVIKFPLDANTVELTAAGATIEIDLTTVAPESIAQAFLYGLGRLFQDRANSAAWAAKQSGKPMSDRAKADYVRELVAAWHDGPIGRTSGSPAIPTDPVASLAIKNAKAELTAMFKELTGKAKIADMVRESVDVAEFFEAKDDKLVWKDGEVVKWMDSPHRDRNFREEAKAALAKAKEKNAATMFKR